MQENNMSVFGTVIRNEEIADFMRLLNLAREIFKQELTKTAPRLPSAWPDRVPPTISTALVKAQCR